MFSKRCKALVLAVSYICLCMTTYARELSNKEMAAITGACKDCVSLEDNTTLCEKKNPCAGCMDGFLSLEGCPLDSETADYYPGATVQKCKSATENTKYCHESEGTEHACYRKYNCTSESVVQDIECERDGDGFLVENSQCTVDSPEIRCRRCKLGTQVAGLSWYMEADDKCNDTAP